jgi:hypothetical protein
LILQETKIVFFSCKNMKLKGLKLTVKIR